jgi:hypothetical protein
MFPAMFEIETLEAPVALNETPPLLNEVEVALDFNRIKTVVLETVPFVGVKVIGAAE